jgi:uncharacterized membrane protein YkvA (DUF1232 family)
MSSPPPDQALIEQGSKKISNEEVQKVVEKAEDIRKKFTAGGPLSRFIEDGKLLIAIVKDYWSGAYRQVPYGTIAAIVFTLLYVFNPLDLVPDVLPIIGQIDDATVVAGCLLFVEQDLQAYKQWKLSQ